MKRTGWADVIAIVVGLFLTFLGGWGAGEDKGRKEATAATNVEWADRIAYANVRTIESTADSVPTRSEVVVDSLGNWTIVVPAYRYENGWTTLDSLTRKMETHILAAREAEASYRSGLAAAIEEVRSYKRDRDRRPPDPILDLRSYGAAETQQQLEWRTSPGLVVRLYPSGDTLLYYPEETGNVEGVPTQ